MHISIIGKSGSKAVSKIVRSTSLTRYSNKCDIIINYGLAGEKLYNFKKNHPGCLEKPMINRKVGLSKFKGIIIASELNIKVPKTFLSLPKDAKPNNFLTKKLHSKGGIGIAVAKSFEQIPNKYYQEFIKNRRYELRVHGFLWEDQQSWEVQKRFGREGEIAWNFNNGGRFQTIKDTNTPVLTQAKDATTKILKAMHMSFGASDFIVTDTNELLFLEINSAPGFTEFSEQIYIKAFSNFIKLTKQQILNYCQ